MTQMNRRCPWAPLKDEASITADKRGWNTSQVVSGWVWSQMEDLSLCYQSCLLDIWIPTLWKGDRGQAAAASESALLKKWSHHWQSTSVKLSGLLWFRAFLLLTANTFVKKTVFFHRKHLPKRQGARQWWLETNLKKHWIPLRMMAETEQQLIQC